MRKIFFLLLLSTYISGVYGQKTYIWCGTLIDGISNEPRKEMTVIIEKNKIVAVEKGFAKPGLKA